MTVKAGIDSALVSSGALMDAFKQVATPLRQDSGTQVDPTRLGKWLAGRKGRLIDGRRLVRVPQKNKGNTQWRLERVLEAASALHPCSRASTLMLADC
ncbi:MAG: hypothetical protein JO266_06440 [Acidobacteria bacterium]|nr:hypothetical protein [Acidobacteriota bacterium]